MKITLTIERSEEIVEALKGAAYNGVRFRAQVTP